MKNHIVFVILAIGSFLIGMNSNYSRFIQFDSVAVLDHRLASYDKKNDTRYAFLAKKFHLSETLGNSTLRRSNVENMIKFFLKHTNSDMPEEQIIEHKRAIITILSPKEVARARL